MAFCADVRLRTYSITHSLTPTSVSCLTPRAQPLPAVYAHLGAILFDPMDPFLDLPCFLSPWTRGSLHRCCTGISDGSLRPQAQKLHCLISCFNLVFFVFSKSLCFVNKLDGTREAAVDGYAMTMAFGFFLSENLISMSSSPGTYVT